MADIRIPSMDFTLGEHTYRLTMNMNVLADLQEGRKGDILSLFQSPSTYKTGLEVGAALLNEAASAEGRPERFTAETLGRILPPSVAINFTDDCINLLIRGINGGEEPEKTEESKN